MQFPIFTAVLSIAVGMALGWWFFTGLWWTLRRLPSARHPAALALGSFVLRMVVVVGVAYILARTHWSLPGFALIGLIAARQWIVARYAMPESE